MIGTTFHRYRILDELGRGGMGVVYRAVDTRLGREVALKFLPDTVADNDAALQRFRREARAASALNHPNICTLYDIGEHEGLHYIAMELLRGSSLQQLIDAGPLPVAQVCRLGVELASALEATHALGIVHRDVKPRNVFVTERGHAKLLDFGLAKSAPHSDDSSLTGFTLDADITQEERVVGTPHYMSPEQALGRRVDGRSDLFSLGAVLYCMATGRRAFEAGSAPATLDAILHREPPPPTQLNRAVPPELERIISRCLAKLPQDRYPDAATLRRDLERVERATEEGVTVVSPELGTAVRAPRRWRLGLALLTVVAMLAALGVFLIRDRAPAPVVAASSPVIAVLPFANQTGDAGQEHLGQALAAGLANELGEIRSLRLVSSSVLGPEREQASGRARELGAQILVEGDVRSARDGNLTVAARLTDAKTGLVLWSQPFSGSVTQLLELEGRMARGLAGFLSIPLSRRERARLGDGTSSLEAMRLYAEGALLLQEPTESQGRERATQAFESAVKLEPRFALAHAGLSQALWMGFQESRDPALLERAVAAAERAARLDPELPQAQLALALVKGADRGEAGELDVAEILARHPRPAAAHRELGVMYERVHLLDRAERAFREATEEDPDDWYNWNFLGVFLFRHRGLDQAAAAFERAIELAPPGVAEPREKLAAIYIQASRPDDAIRLLEEIPDDRADGFTANNLATAYYFSDRADKWEQAEKHYLQAVSRDPQRSDYRGNLADLYVAVGEPEAALQEYRRATELAEEEARSQPDDSFSQIRLALYAAKAQECGRALPLADALAIDVASSSQALHQLALVFSICRERGRTLEMLRAAIDQGFAAGFVGHEEEFRWLRGDPEFEALVAEAGSGAAASTDAARRATGS